MRLQDFAVAVPVPCELTAGCCLPPQEVLPEPARRSIERVCGSPVIEALSQPGGFSPGVAARVRCANGARWFVKAASAELNPDAPLLHRREARVLAGLGSLIDARHLPVPRLSGGQRWQSALNPLRRRFHSFSE